MTKDRLRSALSSSAVRTVHIGPSLAELGRMFGHHHIEQTRRAYISPVRSRS